MIHYLVVLQSLYRMNAVKAIKSNPPRIIAAIVMLPSIVSSHQFIGTGSIVSMVS